MATLHDIHKPCGAQECAHEAQVYAVDPYPDGWGGWFCSDHAEALRWTIVDTIVNDEPRTTDLFGRWDAVRPTHECGHCHGTGYAPGDGDTECGFCE